MAMLCLRPNASSGEIQAREAAREKRWEWLRGLEDLVRKVVGSGEARMWLCSALGSLDLPPAAQRAAFLGIVSASGDEGRKVCERVVRLVCENRPSWAARVISRDERLLRRFFEGNSQRIVQWFGKFSTGMNSEHRWGARALARYTFVHRESCWQELDWKGKHGQAPATVASKPHYFMELDILRTVDNFLDNVPSFWRSEELRESLKDGEFLSLDIDFFIKEFLEKLLVDDCPDTWNMIEEYLAEESTSKLANCLLHFLSEESLLEFINELVFQLPKTSSSDRKSTNKQSSWLQEVILSGERCKTLADAVICNACCNHRRQILNIIRGEEYEEEASTLRRLLSEADIDPGVVWAVRREGLQMSKWIYLKWLGLEAWFLYAYLAEKSEQVCYPDLFRNNDISFDEPPATPKKKKRKRNKKSRKKQRGDDSSDSSSDEAEPESKGWRLATDNFRFLWRKEDLPEHLSSYAFEEWVKWSVSHW